MSLVKSNTQNDGVDTYMAEVKKIPLLTREQEEALAVRLRDDDDVEAAHLLVTSNLRFVVKIAMEYKGYGTRMLDLIQEGNVGLMHAVRKFDPDRGYRLITYAVWWIRAYIRSYLVKAWSMVKIGTTQAQRKLFYKLREAQKELRQSGEGDLLSADDRHALLSERLGVRPKDVSEMEMRMAARDFSLDVAIDEVGETTRLDLLLDEGPDTESLVAAHEINSQLSGDIAAGMARLNAREQEIIQRRYLSDDKPTLKEVGASWGVSRERARQIEAAAKKKLGAYLVDNSRALRALLPEVLALPAAA